MGEDKRKEGMEKWGMVGSKKRKEMNNNEETSWLCLLSIHPFQRRDAGQKLD